MTKFQDVHLQEKSSLLLSFKKEDSSFLKKRSKRLFIKMAWAG